MKEISLHILDLIQNSIRAGAANISLDILEDSQADTFTVVIQDDGCGMSPEMAKPWKTPLSPPVPPGRWGWASPCLRQAVKIAAAAFSSRARRGRDPFGGTYQRSHIDRPPLGNVADTVLLLITGNPNIHFYYHHRVDQREYQLDTEELMRILDGAPLDAPEITAFIRDFLVENESELYGGS